MAYPTVDAPYGLKPINLIGGQPYAGSTRQITIASGYATNIFCGDVVKRVADGTLEKDTGTSTTATTGVIGVFMGCTYTDPGSNTKTFKQYWPASTAASDAKAYVVDDPDALFKVAVVSSSTTGNSKVAINGIATTLTLPMRIIDVVEETADSDGNFTEVIVKWNAPYEDSNIAKGGHAYMVATGL